ncbi:MAG: hypothetical protein Q4G08_05860 [Capnocytophaga sp.]|nr:hypothetical protein [Capnocytophaga sp.]
MISYHHSNTSITKTHTNLYTQESTVTSFDYGKHLFGGNVGVGIVYVIFGR